MPTILVYMTDEGRDVFDLVSNGLYAFSTNFIITTVNKIRVSP